MKVTHAITAASLVLIGAVQLVAQSAAAAEAKPARGAKTMAAPATPPPPVANRRAQTNATTTTHVGNTAAINGTGFSSKGAGVAKVALPVKNNGGVSGTKSR